MKFYNKETGKYFNVAMIDERSGVDCAEDLINKSDYEYDDEKEAYTLNSFEESLLRDWLDTIGEYGTDGDFDYPSVEIYIEE